MILRFPVWLHTGSPNKSKVYALKIVVDGTTILNSADASLESYPLAPVVTTNGLSVVIDEDSTTIKATITGLRVWESTDVRLEITKATYNTYINTFKVFGYDLGNNTGSLNPDFNIYLMGTSYAASNAYANLIAYRQPFSKRIYFYNATSSNAVTMSATGFSMMGTNGYICAEEETDITADQTVGVTSSSTTLTVGIKQWFPSYGLSVDCPDCTSDSCISLVDDPTVRVDIDFDTWNDTGFVYVDGTQVYPLQNLAIEYKLISHDGTLVDSAYFPVDISTFPLTTFDAEDYKWSAFTIPEMGDYIIQACLVNYDVLSEQEISSGETVVGSWYKIIDNSGAADFTTIGSPNNTVGTEFMADDTTPTWGTGILEAITPAYKCCKNAAISACAVYNTTKTDCNVYSLNNNSFSDVYAIVKKMTSLGEFEAMEDSPYTIAARSSQEITLDDDGVYTVTYVTSLTEDTGESIQVIHNYCNLTGCLLSLIKSSICGCKEVDECENLCKNFYFFNSIIILSMSYFGMVNREYQMSYIYSSLDSDKVAELFTTQQMLERLGEYCACINASSGSSNSSGSSSGCGCS